MTELKRLSSAADLPTKEELKSRPKPPRLVGFEDGLYFGAGFWLAFVGVVFIASPIAACAVYIALAIR